MCEPSPIFHLLAAQEYSDHNGDEERNHDDSRAPRLFVRNCHLHVTAGLTGSHCLCPHAAGVKVLFEVYEREVVVQCQNLATARIYNCHEEYDNEDH